MGDLKECMGVVGAPPVFYHIILPSLWERLRRFLSSHDSSDIGPHWLPILLFIGEREVIGGLALDLS